MRLHLATDAGKELVEKIGFFYELNISPKKVDVNEEVFVGDLKKGDVFKRPCEKKPDATFSFADDDFLAISSGRLNPQMTFIQGKLRIKGEPMEGRTGPNQRRQVLVVLGWLLIVFRRWRASS